MNYRWKRKEPRKEGTTRDCNDQIGPTTSDIAKVSQRLSVCGTHVESVSNIFNSVRWLHDIMNMFAWNRQVILAKFYLPIVAV